MCLRLRLYSVNLERVTSSETETSPFHVFAAEEMGITGNNKLELTAFILDDFEL